MYCTTSIISCVRLTCTACYHLSPNLTSTPFISQSFNPFHCTIYFAIPKPYLTHMATYNMVNCVTLTRITKNYRCSTSLARYSKKGPLRKDRRKVCPCLTTPTPVSLYWTDLETDEFTEKNRNGYKVNVRQGAAQWVTYKLRQDI